MNCVNCEKRCEIFNLLKVSDLEKVSEQSFSISYKKGEVIVKQGTKLQHVLNLTEGFGKVYLEGKNRDLILKILTKRELIAGPGMYIDSKNHYTIVALTDATVCYIDVELFKKMVFANVQFSDAFRRLLSTSKIRLYQRMLSLTQKNMSGRIADVLLHLSNEVFQLPEFPLLLSRQEIADMANVSRENVSRILNDMNKEEIIKLNGKSMKILNKKSLESLSEFG